MAIEHRRPDPGFIMHTDRVAQYISTDFRALLKAHHGVQSLSRKGQCWDNDPASPFVDLSGDGVLGGLDVRRH
jgi:putative transposase